MRKTLGLLFLALLQIGESFIAYSICGKYLDVASIQSTKSDWNPM